MGLFRRRKPSWPSELERRLPENADRREEEERKHRAHLAAKAHQAAEQVSELTPRVDRLEDIARWIDIDRRRKQC